jgi:hypothetical protein
MLIKIVTYCYKLKISICKKWGLTEYCPFHGSVIVNNGANLRTDDYDVNLTSKRKCYSTKKWRNYHLLFKFKQCHFTLTIFHTQPHKKINLKKLEAVPGKYQRGDISRNTSNCPKIA